MVLPTLKEAKDFKLQFQIIFTYLMINLLINASNYLTLFLVFAVVVSFFPVRSQLGASLVTGGGTSPLNEERKEVYQSLNKFCSSGSRLQVLWLNVHSKVILPPRRQPGQPHTAFDCDCLTACSAAAFAKKKSRQSRVIITGIFFWQLELLIWLLAVVLYCILKLIQFLN